MHHCISLNGTTKHFAHQLTNGFKIFGCDHKPSRLGDMDRRPIGTADGRRMGDEFFINCEREDNRPIELISEFSDIGVKLEIMPTV